MSSKSHPDSPAVRYADPMRRVGLLGDIHAEHVSLRFALQRFETEAVDAVLSVGDIVDGPGDVEATITLLVEHDVLAVAGNHERWFLRDQMRELPDATRTLSADASNWLRGLPPSRCLDTVAGPLLLCHGVGDDDMIRLLPDSSDYDVHTNGPLQRLLAEDEVRVLVGGHTHRRMVRRFGNLTVINPGTLFREHDPCFAIADLETLSVDFVDLESSA